MLSLLWALSFVACGYAAPVQPLAPRAIDNTLFSRLKLMQQYTAAAYCDSNVNATTSPDITCEAGNCPLVTSSGASTVAEFENTPITDTTGFVAIDPANSLIVVAFRGSRSIRNWIADFTFDAVDTDFCDACTAHSGFWTSWTEVRSAVLAAVASATAKYPSYGLALVGHSLGGATATLAAAELRRQGYTAALYTFGAPRLAGPSLSQLITDQPGGNYRVTHYNDIVPRLPPIAFGYVHISPEYYIDQKNDVQVTASDVSVCDGLVNYTCNTAWVLTDAGAHNWYFQNEYGCVGEGVEFRRAVEIESF